MINWFSAAKIGHYFLTEVIQPGHTVMDGTMGNGHDTCLLAKLVGEQGKVYAFDIQAQALQKTRERLAENGLDYPSVALIQDSHQHVKKYINHPIQGAIFNLGYLPGGDHQVITQTHTTQVAISDTLDLLTVGGRMVIVVYPGHPGGAEEKAVVEEITARLDSLTYKVLKLNLLNRPPSAPGVILIEKARDT